MSVTGKPPLWVLRLGVCAIVVLEEHGCPKFRTATPQPHHFAFFLPTHFVLCMKCVLKWLCLLHPIHTMISVEDCVIYVSLCNVASECSSITVVPSNISCEAKQTCTVNNQSITSEKVHQNTVLDISAQYKMLVQSSPVSQFSTRKDRGCTLHLIG